jgi:hypothetical protein
LGEFSPVGRLFAFGSGLKITEVAQTLCHFFATIENILEKSLGFILGDLFMNSYGHPGVYVMITIFGVFLMNQCYDQTFE